MISPHMIIRDQIATILPSIKDGKVYTLTIEITEIIFFLADDVYWDINFVIKSGIYATSLKKTSS